MRRIPPVRLLAAAALLLLAACGQSGDDKINARSQNDFDGWMTDATGQMEPNDVRLLRQAQQEIKLDVMAHTNATGEDAISAAFLQKVNGLTAKQMITLGLKDRVARLTAERDESKRLLDANSSMKAGDDKASAALTSRVDEDRERYQRAVADLQITETDLKLHP